MASTSHPSRLVAFASKRPFVLAVIGSLLLWCSFPPLGFWPLAWVALVPWITLIAVPEFESPKAMRSIWFAGLLYWAAETYFIPIPHPALWIAWIMLFAYLSVYPVLFVWIGRKMFQQWPLPLPLAAAIVFTALEWIRAHLMGGYGFSMLSNSQYTVPGILQICDVAGGYGLSFLMTLFASFIFLIACCSKRRIGHSMAALATVGLVSGYAWLTLGPITDRLEHSGIWIMQGSIDTRFPNSLAEIEAYEHDRQTHYADLQRDWISRLSPSAVAPELVIWPEGKYPIPDILPGAKIPRDKIEDPLQNFHQYIFGGQPSIQPSIQTSPMLVGGGSFDIANDDQYNSAIFLDASGKVVNRYFKIHRVLFGEYVPFSNWFPILEKITPIGKGLSAGQSPIAIAWKENVYLVPNICFESSNTHLIRSHVNQLASQNKQPAVLVNLTDDGWFYGTALLDQHLACNVMRAIENRKPVLVAANTGFSASIDSSGRILDRGPRRAKAVLETGFTTDDRYSLYRRIGDWPPIFMTVLCVAAVLTRRKMHHGI